MPRTRIAALEMQFRFRSARLPLSISEWSTRWRKRVDRMVIAAEIARMEKSLAEALTAADQARSRSALARPRLTSATVTLPPPARRRANARKPPRKQSPICASVCRTFRGPRTPVPLRPILRRCSSASPRSNKPPIASSEIAKASDQTPLRAGPWVLRCCATRSARHAVHAELAQAKRSGPTPIRLSRLKASRRPACRPRRVGAELQPSWGCLACPIAGVRRRLHRRLQAHAGPACAHSSGRCAGG